MDSNNGASAYEAFQAFWEAGHRPDAIVAANGQGASGAMAYLYQKGIKVPEEVSVIAYEDSSICGYATPALTGVNIRKEELGYGAAQCMMARLKNPGKEVELKTLSPYLVRRNSVKRREEKTDGI